MKQRFSSHMPLIELTLSLFFLMSASVTILGVFTTAYEKSRESEAVIRAVQAAQDCAALIMADTDPEQMLRESGYQADLNGVFERNIGGEMSLRVQMHTEQTEVGYVISGQVTVLLGDEELLRWPVMRYYNKEVIHP